MGEGGFGVESVCGVRETCRNFEEISSLGSANCELNENIPQIKVIPCEKRVGTQTALYQIEAYFLEMKISPSIRTVYR